MDNTVGDGSLDGAPKEEMRSSAVAPGEDLADLYARLELEQKSIDILEGMDEGLRDRFLCMRMNTLKLREERKAAEKEKRRLHLLGLLTEEEKAEAEAQRRQEELLRLQEQDNAIRIREKFCTSAGKLEAGLPLLFHECTIENIVERGVPEELAYPQQRVGDYMKKLPQLVKQGDGLILSGPVGTLKTSLASAVMLEGIRQGIEPRFVLTMRLVDDLVALERTNPAEYRQEMDRLCRVPLLVLDDFGAEGSHAEFVRKKLEQVIFDRHANKKAMLITTNLTPVELERMYSQRVMDRLRECCTVLEVRAKSLRSTKAS